MAFLDLILLPFKPENSIFEFHIFYAILNIRNQILEYT